MPRLLGISAWNPWIADPDELERVVDTVELIGAEMCISPRLDKEMVAACCRHGFMPLADVFDGEPLLIIKSHDERCLLHFDALHVPDNTRRYARGLELRIDYDFETCLGRIVTAYPDTWLVPPLAHAYRALNRSPDQGVSMHSVEVYHSDALVAGEIGYVVGSVYTSLTGFHARNGSGTVQLVCLAELLRELGFAFWDLGMDVAYKHALGAVLYERRAFLEMLTEHRDEHTSLATLPRSCEELVGNAWSGMRTPAGRVDSKAARRP